MIDGNYEPDVCLICGMNVTVSAYLYHRPILNHVLDFHFNYRPGEARNMTMRCWCGFIPDPVGQIDTRQKMLHHLGGHIRDLNMTFPTSVDQLWAHYHASMIGIDPEGK